MERFLENYPHARVVLEVGAHSRWASQVAVEICAEVLVANPRKLSSHGSPSRGSPQNLLDIRL